MAGLAEFDKVYKLARRVAAADGATWRRRGAARRLARMASPLAAEKLAGAVVSTQDSRVAEIAHRAFAGATDQAVIDAVCRVWRDTRDLRLGELIGGHRWLATEPAELRVLTALRGEHLDVLAAEPELARALVLIAQGDQDRGMRKRAWEVVVGLPGQQARDAVCEVAVMDGSLLALDAVSEGGFSSSRPAHQAVLLLLAGHFDRYAELDFDGVLVRSVRAFLPAGVRSRLAHQARAAGSVDWVRGLTGQQRSDRLAELTDAEAEVVLQVLAGAKRWADLWAMVPDSPVRWSARILRLLDKQGWVPDLESERAGAARLTALARQCDGGLPAGVVFDHAGECRISSGGPRPLFAVSPDGALLAERADGYLVIRRVPSGGITAQRKYHGGPVGCLSFTTDGQFLVVGGGADDAGTLDLLQVPTGDPVVAPRSQPHRVCRLALSADGRLLATAGRDGRVVRLWRLPSLEPAGSVESEVTVTALAFTPDGDMLVTGGPDGKVRLWSMPSGDLARTIISLEAHLSIGWLALSPDGTRMVTGENSGHLRQWSLPTGTPADPVELTPEQRGPRELSGVTITRDGNLVAAAHSGTGIWRLPSGRAAGMLGPGSAPTLGFAATADGALLVAAQFGRATFFRSALHVLGRTPVGQVDLAEVERLRAVPAAAPAELAWLALIETLSGWRRRHDIEVSDASHGTGPAAADIEL